MRIFSYLGWQAILFFSLLIGLDGNPNANESGTNTKGAGDKDKIVSKKSQSSIRNEYILTLRKGTGSERLKELLPDFKIIRIEKIGENTFHIVFESDPGIELLKTAGKKRGSSNQSSKIKFIKHFKPK